MVKGIMNDLAQESSTVRGYCALCTAHCATIATVTDGKVVRLDADFDHPNGGVLCIKGKAAPQRAYRLRAVFNALRWMARTGAAGRMLPHDFPPWAAVYPQTQRWLKAGVFEAIVEDLRVVLRVAQGRAGQPSAAILDSRTLQSSPESGHRAG